MFNPGPLSAFISNFLFFLNYFIVPAIFAIAFLAFLWGVYTYFIASQGDAEKRGKGKDFVLYSIIGLVLMLSVWGIVNVIMGTLGFNSQARPSLPLFGASNNTTTTTSQSCPNGTKATDCPSGYHLDCTYNGGQCVR